MRALSFERSIGFALAAAAVAGTLGTTGAQSLLGFYLEPALLWASVAGYLWAAGGLRSGLVGLAVACVGVGLLHQLALDPSYGNIGAALCLGILRSQLARNHVERSPEGAPRARRLVVELVLGTVALASANHLDDGSALGLGLGIWGFWLTHCAYPLLVRTRSESEQPPSDPFEVARNRARRVLVELRDSGVTSRE
jgi:hypothetical protein